MDKKISYSRESIEGLRAIVDPKDILVSFGGINPKFIHDSGDEIRCPCPIHGGDNRSAFSWKRSKGMWMCYTHNCGESSRHDIFAFVSLKMNISFIEAVRRIADMVGYTLQEGTYESTSFYKTAQGPIKDHRAIDKLDVPKLSKLTYLPNCYPQAQNQIVEYLKTRGYNPNIIGAFHLYPLRDSYGLIRLGIPVYDVDGDLVGVNARLMDTIISYPKIITLSDGTEIEPPKYKMTTFKKGAVLFNLNQAKSHSILDGIIVVEGQLDVMRLHTYGILNSVCTMGTSLTEHQAALLYKNTYKTTFLVEEGEPAIKGVRRSVKLLSHGMGIRIAKLPAGDADSNSKETVINTLNSAVELYPDQVAAFSAGYLTV